MSFDTGVYIRMTKNVKISHSICFSRTLRSSSAELEFPGQFEFFPAEISNHPNSIALWNS